MIFRTLYFSLTHLNNRFLYPLFQGLNSQGRVSNTSVGSWFQSWMVLFTKEYFPISVLSLLQLIFCSWSTHDEACFAAGCQHFEILLWNKASSRETADSNSQFMQASYVIKAPVTTAMLTGKIKDTSSFIQYSVWRQVQSLLQNDSST